MKSIGSQSDFEAMLQAERAILFVYFAWSEEAERSRRVVEQWERQWESQGAALNCTVYQLAPDGHPHTWKWMGKNAAGTEEAGNEAGAVVWLRQGAVAGRVRSAAEVGMKTLTRLTKEHFGLEMPSGGEETPGFDAELLKILCCPETHQEIAPARASVLENLNRRIALGGVRNRGGQPVREKVQGGLVRADGRYLYPIREEIPMLLVDEAIPLSGD